MDCFSVHCFLREIIPESYLPSDQLVVALKEAECQQVSLVSYLVEKVSVKPADFLSLLAKALGISFIDLNKLDTSQLPLQLVDKALLQKYQVLPLWKQDKKLGLAVVDPTEQEVIHTIRFYTGLAVEKILVEPDKLDILRKKNKLQSFLSTNQPETTGTVELATSPAIASVAPVLNKEEALHNESAVSEYVDKLLNVAIFRGASDMHLEPHKHSLKIRFRIDGLLYVIASVSIFLLQRIITRFKIMSQLDIAERRMPQDGRFQIKKMDGRSVDCRISTCPTLYGEKIAIRILDSNQRLLKIDNLGMDASQTDCFLEALRCPQGMILVTGPTGSGKTITLYTALNFLNSSHVNISSVENPIEIVLAGVNQVNVNPKVGLDFSTVLRAFLRQDPDVIMVGEMRDQETAEIGIKAAQTGHLVLSSLHTNSAVESLIRLANMGIPLYNIASSVSLIVAQRLARCLCRHCKIPDDLPESVLLDLGFSNQASQRLQLFKAKGCEQCTDGYKGRVGIFEILVVTDEVKRLILQSCDIRAINFYTKSKQWSSLHRSALAKLKQGKISVLEMKRIIKD